jgi:hypothetical protein
MQRIHADAVSKSRAVATYVLFASNLVPLSQVYMVAYGHGTLEGPARSCAAARDRAALDPTCGDARVRTGPSARVRIRSTSSRRILPRDRSPTLPRAAHPATLVGGTRSASPSRARAVQALACVRVCARPLSVRRSAERPILLARQSAGGVETDMALSKWFLCGAEGAFDKDETLAFTFAEKAARKGLLSAEFAMGYYKEVGVGGSKDFETARMWYQLVSRARVDARMADHVDARLPITATRMRSSVWRRYLSRPHNRSRGRDTMRSRNRSWCVSARRRSSVQNARAVRHRDRRSRIVDRWLTLFGRTRRRGSTDLDRGLGRQSCRPSLNNNNNSRHRRLCT